MTEAGIENIVGLQKIQQIFYNRYLIRLQEKEVKDLIVSNSKINAISATYTESQGLGIWESIIMAQKIDKSILATYKIVLAVYFRKNKLRQVWLFEKTLIVADISIKVILRILFFLLSNADVQFADMKKLT